jgi:predicted amidohydrolase YtcJ
MTRTLLFLLLSAFAAKAQAPDVIYHNGAIITMSASHPSAQAVAIRGDRFIAVGSNSDVLKTAGPRTQKIDLGGKCMVPGIIESHVHPIGAALSEIDGPVPVVHSIAEL